MTKQLKKKDEGSTVIKANAHVRPALLQTQLLAATESATMHFADSTILYHKQVLARTRYIAGLSAVRIDVVPLKRLAPSTPTREKLLVQMIQITRTRDNDTHARVVRAVQLIKRLTPPLRHIHTIEDVA